MKTLHESILDDQEKIIGDATKAAKEMKEAARLFRVSASRTRTRHFHHDMWDREIHVGDYVVLCSADMSRGIAAGTIVRVTELNEKYDRLGYAIFRGEAVEGYGDSHCMTTLIIGKIPKNMK